jgi:hypothetical protein
MELVIEAVRIPQAQGRKARMLEMLKVHESCNLGVEASIAEHLPRAVQSRADEVVCRSGFVATVAFGLAHDSTG